MVVGGWIYWHGHQEIEDKECPPLTGKAAKLANIRAGTLGLSLS